MGELFISRIQELVRTLIDGNGTTLSSSDRSGNINVRTVRDSSGNITGLEVLRGFTREGTEKEERIETNVDISNDVVMPFGLISVRRNDEKRFTADEWTEILAKIENGEIFWED